MARSKKNANVRRGGKRKTVDKKDVAETRTAVSQMKLPGENRLKEIMANVKGYKDKIATYTGKLREYFKQIKAEGVKPAVINEMIRMERADPLEEREHQEQLAIGMRAIGMPHQMLIFDSAYGNVEQQARAEARAQAERGLAMDPTKYPENSSPWSAYRETYQEIIIKRAEKFGEAQGSA